MNCSWSEVLLLSVDSVDIYFILILLLIFPVFYFLHHAH